MTARSPARATVRLSLCAALGLLAACAPRPPAESADDYAARVNSEIEVLGDESQRANWVQQTYINGDTEALAARASERYLAYHSKAVAESSRYTGQPMAPESARMLQLLRIDTAAPAPADAGSRGELAEIMARMESAYSTGRHCPAGPDSCQTFEQLAATMARSRDYDEQLGAWQGWHDVGITMREDYQRFVELANEGAREIGFADLGEMWRSGYDMSPAEFSAETERLWGQVKPLYDGMHCYARGALQKKYGKERVPDGQPIPAHLLGNMWAQQWNNIFDLLEPYPGVTSLDVTGALKKQGYDPVRMTRSAEDFYVSLGFQRLPESFWQKSLLSRPRDRDVVCYASAWDMPGYDDVRIKQCIEATEEELYTVYHELGHVYYYLAYRDQPYLFRGGAHDGFHEAVGDTVNLSMTEGYLASQGLIPPGQRSSTQALINRQMKVAAEKIAFLPFGKLMDHWRWGVFSGAIPPEKYNEAWWDLRREYQGIAPAVARSAADFDPAAKYHIPGNTPYTRYFLSFVMQFQFHKALCEAAGFRGPLHECSVFGNEEAGRRFREMLAMGASQPWQDALEKLTGTRQMDASAIIEYFQPLMGWLEEQNAGRECGW